MPLRWVVGTELSQKHAGVQLLVVRMAHSGTTVCVRPFETTGGHDEHHDRTREEHQTRSLGEPAQASLGPMAGSLSGAGRRDLYGPNGRRQVADVPHQDRRSYLARGHTGDLTVVDDAVTRLESGAALYDDGSCVEELNRQAERRYGWGMEWNREVNNGRIEWREPNDGMSWNGYVWTAQGTVLSDRALRSMGLIAYWAAWLEAHVEQALSEVLFGLRSDSWRVSRVLTREMSASQMLDKLRAVARIHGDPDAEALATIEQARASLVERNRVLHGAMGGHLEPGNASLMSRRKSEMTEVSDEELDQIAELVFDAAMAVSNFRWSTLGAASQDS